MNLIIDYNKFKKIINSMPEKEPMLNGKTEGFKYLYKKVFLPLLNCNEDYANLDADVSCFDFDDLVDFDSFIHEKCDYNSNNPILVLDKIFDKLTPIRKPAVFI